MKSNYLVFLAAMLSLVGLAGCVLVVDGTDGDKAEWASTWEMENGTTTQDNKDLARQVGTVLAADSELAGEHIKVSARRGAVALYGKVTNTQAVDRALQLAANVPGVASVVSRLSVEYSGQ